MKHVDSKILSPHEDLPLLKSWFDDRPFHLRLLYRGSDHGFNRSAFAKQCNNRYPTTLVLIKSEMNNIFGGFTSVPWTTPAGEPSNWKYHSDPEAFLFSLTQRTKHKPYQN
jgi:hypothetical protein